MSSARSSTRSLSLDQPVVEQPAVLQRRSEELHQREQAAVHSKPRLPIIPVLDRIDCDEILKNHSGSYNAEQNSVASLRQDISLALLRTASECVFAMVELLDSTLLLLPAKNLFILQRVSRTWKQIVAQSMAIQRKMFLRLNKTSPDIWELLDLVDIHLDHLHVKIRKRDFVKFRRVVQTRDTDHAQDRLILPITLNPLMKSLSSRLDNIDENRTYLEAPGHWGIRALNWQIISYTGTSDTLKHTAAMHVSDPPIHHARLTVTFFYRDTSQIYSYIKANFFQRRSEDGRYTGESP